MHLQTNDSILAILLTFALATTAMAQSPEARGTVARLDAPANVIMLEDGRMYRVTPSTVVLVDNQPVPLTAIQPGSVVVLRSPEFVTLRDGHYGTVTFVIVRSGPAQLARWLTERRNVSADYRRIYGEDPAPVRAIALSIDTNDTRAPAETFVGPIVFRKA